MLWVGILLSCFFQPPTIEFVPAYGGLGGGGPVEMNHSGCIAPAERMEVQAAIRRFQAINPTVMGAPSKYPMYPQSGNLWDDLFVNNFTDIDLTSGERDYECTNFVYNGHQGHDSDIRSFMEQELGYPVQAVLDGQVVATRDGEFDRQTSASGAPANYVVLWHGGDHLTYYWHLRRNSVAVSVGQMVRAGQHLGMTASSGSSTYPHLHFESWNDNNWFEPSAGACRSGSSHWQRQTNIRRDMYLREFAMTDQHIGNYPGLPWELPRKGTFAPGQQPLYWYMIVHNLPAFSNWRFRFFRPDNTLHFDTGTYGFNNTSPYRWAWFWWFWSFSTPLTGQWRIDVVFNGNVVASAPFFISNDATAGHGPPAEPTSVSLDPPIVRADRPVALRVRMPLIRHRNYHPVTYRYRWLVNDAVVREAEHGAHSDVLPVGSFQPGDVVRGEVIVMESLGNGRGPYGAQTIVDGGDANGDGCVDDTDLAIVLSQFGLAHPPADFNEDGVVDDTDLAIVLSAFGRGC